MFFTDQKLILLVVYLLCLFFSNIEWQYLTEVKKKILPWIMILKMCLHSVAVLLGCLLRDLWGERIYQQEILARQKLYTEKKKFNVLCNCKLQCLHYAGDLYKYTNHRMTHYHKIIIANQPHIIFWFLHTTFSIICDSLVKKTFVQEFTRFFWIMHV